MHPTSQEIELRTWNLFQTYLALLNDTDLDRNVMQMAEFISIATSVGEHGSTALLNPVSTLADLIPKLNQFADHSTVGLTPVRTVRSFTSWENRQENLDQVWQSEKLYSNRLSTLLTKQDFLKRSKRVLLEISSYTTELSLNSPHATINVTIVPIPDRPLLFTALTNLSSGFFSQGLEQTILWEDRCLSFSGARHELERQSGPAPLVREP